MKRRRWLQYRLRTLLIIVTVICVALGWLEMQRRWVGDRRSAFEWAKKHEAFVEYPLERTVSNTGKVTFKPVPQPSLGLRLPGEPPIKTIFIRHTKSSDEAMLKKLARLFPESEILFEPAFE